MYSQPVVLALQDLSVTYKYCALLATTEASVLSSFLIRLLTLASDAKLGASFLLCK
jgi:hypothetical protein